MIVNLAWYYYSLDRTTQPLDFIAKLAWLGVWYSGNKSEINRALNFSNQAEITGEDFFRHINLCLVARPNDLI